MKINCRRCDKLRAYRLESHISLLPYSLSHTGSVHARSGISSTALHAAVAAGSSGAVRALLAAGADPESPNEPSGARALHIAAAHGYPTVVCPSNS